jgi:Domain of unknown function (DUF4167)
LITTTVSTTGRAATRRKCWKNKKLAQDAQFNGDRVNAEYHLQFADHYFRVLADFRGRQEARAEQQGERRPPRDENRDDNRDDWRDQNAENGYEDMDSGDQRERETGSEVASEEREEQPRRESREERPRRERNERNNRGDRDGNRAPRRHHSEEAADEPAGLDIAVLPPSIALANDDDVEAEAAKPARKPRARRPKSANDEETVTAAE